VRKLAEQSQLSANQIKSLIEEIQMSMLKSSNSMNLVKNEVQEGLEIAERTEKSFKEISSNMNDLGLTITSSYICRTNVNQC